MMAGVGVKSFAEGLQILTTVGPSGITTLTNAILAMIELMPTMVATLITSVIETTTSMIPQIVGCFVKMIEELLKTISDRLPKIMKYGIKIVTTLLKGIRDNIKNIVEISADIIVGFINGISKKLPDIIQAGVNLVFAFIDGISDALANNGDRAREALIKLGKSMLKGIKDFFGIHSPSKVFKNIGKYLIEGLKNGISDFGPKAVSKLKIKMQMESTTYTGGDDDTILYLRSLLDLHVTVNLQTPAVQIQDTFVFHGYILISSGI